MIFLQFIDDGDDAAIYPADRLLSMTCAANATLLLNFESSVGKSDGADSVALTITADKEREIMQIITEAIISADRTGAGYILIADDVSKAAFTTITITDYTELNNGDKVNLIATDTNDYDFVAGDQSSVAGTFEATTSNEQTATNLMNVINTSSGPSGSRFTATVDGAIVTATQATGGTAGNTAVTITETGGSGMSARATFIQGAAGKYIDNRITACAISLDT
tara:strand:+ start:111 stop:779 length:669 start_codon:yes stop_codon:yes gene_type:complete